MLPMRPMKTNINESVCDAALQNKRILELYEEKLDKSAGPAGCWPWLACKEGFSTTHNGKRGFISAQRAAWIIAHGPIRGYTRKMKVIRCEADSRCCNPAHLRLATSWEVSRESMRRGPQETERRARELREAQAERQKEVE